MGLQEPKIKRQISYITDCSSEYHHMPFDTCRDEKPFIMSIDSFYERQPQNALSQLKHREVHSCAHPVKIRMGRWLFHA